MNRILALGLTAALGAALYFGWEGFRLGPLAWDGAWTVIGGTWLWDLRHPLIPAYVVGMLWLAERLRGLFGPS